MTLKKALKAYVGFLLDLMMPRPEHPTLAYPGLHLSWRKGWVRGLIYRTVWRIKYRLTLGPQVVIGRRFSLQGKMIVSGPGRIELGDDVVVDGVSTPFTHTSQAVISIGSKSFVNGTRFGCSNAISIGEGAILADARLMDTDFHAVHEGRNRVGAVPETKPINVGKNVWISAGSAVLKGVEIGDNCVIAFGSVVVKSIAANKIAGGNPAKEIADVPKDPKV